jgi:hypothetical protein
MLNEENNRQHITVVIVDVATGRETTKLKNGLAVLDWLPAN